MSTPQYIIGARAKCPTCGHVTTAAPRIGILPNLKIVFATPKLRKHYGNKLDLTFGPGQLAVARKWARQNGKELVVKTADPYPHLRGDRDCNSNLLVALEKTAQILSKQHGRTIYIDIRSGRRTYAEQKKLYDQNMIAPGRPKPGRPLTAYPNAKAPHTLGIAADCGIEGKDIGDFPGAIKALDRAGGCLPVRTEDWHVQLGENFAGANS